MLLMPMKPFLNLRKECGSIKYQFFILYFKNACLSMKCLSFLRQILMLMKLCPIVLLAVNMEDVVKNSS